MPDIDPATIVPNLLFGSLVMFIGLVAVWLRRSFFELTERRTKEMYPGAGELMSRHSSPFWVAAAGVFMVLLGLVMVCAGIIGLVQLWT
jgi:multisubunit Na+/H+ antiporter MnhG subunit